MLLLVSALTAAGAIADAQRPFRSEFGFAAELLHWQPVGSGALFAGTGAGSWDHHIRERGYILREGDRYHLWYTGYNPDLSDTKSLGYASSPDGRTWTRHPHNPIHSEDWVEDMFVVKHRDTYYMFAEGRDDIAHLLTSADGLRWQSEGSLDIRDTRGQPIAPGPYGTPTVWIENDTWYLYYERNDSGIWLASSTDLETWTLVRDDPVIAPGPADYDRHAVALNQIISHGGKYYALYHASAHRPWRDWSTNLAVSTDLVHWRKYPGNPIVSGDRSSGILVHDGERFRLYTLHPDMRLYFPAAPPRQDGKGP